MRFVTRRVEVEAVQFTGDNWEEMQKFVGHVITTDSGGTSIGFRRTASKRVGITLTAEVFDRLHSTWIGVAPGQWIVRGVKGEFYPCDNETFFWKYEALND